MQNRYVGDIGDFGKYGLLRHLLGAAEDGLCTARRLRLAVIWYLYPDESHNLDGKHTGYLKRTRQNEREFRSCDPVLYDALAKLIGGSHRHVSRVRSSGILPTETTYYEQSLSFQGEGRGPARQQAREKWLRQALAVARGADLVFVDPDNGIANREGCQRPSSR